MTAWWEPEEADFWLEVEHHMGAQWAGTREGVKRLVRSPAGQRVLEHLRVHRPDCQRNAATLARHALAL